MTECIPLIQCVPINLMPVKCVLRLKWLFFLLPAFFFCCQTLAQQRPWEPRWLPKHPRPPERGGTSRPLLHTTLNPVPLNRWMISFNPLGLIEPQTAIGLGIGYRFSQKTEIVSETSLLRSWVYISTTPVTGIRQVLQVKRLLYANYFVAVEARYKSYSFHDTTDFYNPVTQDSLHHFGYLSSHHFFGIAAQAGRRYYLSKNGALQIELTFGLGFKDKFFDKVGVPGGYGYVKYHSEINIERDIVEYRGVMVYFPGSVRVIYNFGKRLN